ncbi:hypothetical protein F5X68DRAFT_208649 [Plectosphaerella plurivora]|uniref:Uncharacterized protein n=1 Tax=Plectosphaerella plurivora TaxID=936078 RepID=A0A9P8VC70_9PEZI|nr:hypothetical protein F5X68DRAFT_208649 [Plectosphaerella plurivora]
MPARQDSYSVSIPVSPPPPSDINSYQRFMHQHTKKQMEAAGRSSHRRSNGHRGSIASTTTNGTTSPDA